MAETKVIGARVPRVIFEEAREALGLPEDARDSDVIRHVFAAVAGHDLSGYVFRPGPAPRARTEQGAAA